MKADIQPRFDTGLPGLSHHPPIMEELLRASMPPDEELVDLIEWAFVEDQIDGVTADLAYAWLLRRSGQWKATSRAGD